MVHSNTNQDYNIYISAGQDYRQKYNNNLSTAQLFIAPKVEVTYESDASTTRKSKKHRTWQSFTAPKSSRTRKIIDEHKTPKLFQFHCNELTSDDGTQSSSSWGLISGMISYLKLPFLLELNLQWRVQDGILKIPQQEKPWIRLENQDDLIRKILDLARCMAKEDSNIGHKVASLYVTIKKEVILPQYEFEALVRDRAEKGHTQNIDAIIALMIDSQVLLARNLTPTEWRRKINDELRKMDVTLDLHSLESLMERASTETEERILIGLKPAKLSSIQALEIVEVCDIDLGSMEACTICMEDFVLGCSARMPCTHTFHEHCIKEWLFRSHMCPLCRFELPTHN